MFGATVERKGDSRSTALKPSASIDALCDEETGFSEVCMEKGGRGSAICRRHLRNDHLTSLPPVHRSVPRHVEAEETDASLVAMFGR